VLDLRTRSSEAGDLAHDLEAAATEFASQYPARFTLVVTGKERALNSLIAEELYKLGCEAMFNHLQYVDEADAFTAKAARRVRFRPCVIALPLKEEACRIGRPPRLAPVPCGGTTHPSAELPRHFIEFDLIRHNAFLSLSSSLCMC
jgi:hypothetical protein